MTTTVSQSRDQPESAQPVLGRNAMTVLENRYLIRDENGRVTETPAELFQRVASAVAAVEQTWGTSDEERARIEEQFYHAMASGVFLPMW